MQIFVRDLKPKNYFVSEKEPFDIDHCSTEIVPFVYGRCVSRRLFKPGPQVFRDLSNVHDSFHNSVVTRRNILNEIGATFVFVFLLSLVL